MTKKLKIIVISTVLPVLIVLASVFGLSAVFANDEVTFDFDLAEEYFNGDKLSSEVVSATCGETPLETNLYLTYPSGKTVSGDKFTLDESGKYTIIAAAEHNGAIENDSRSFIVKTPLFEVAEGDSCEYRNHPFNDYTGEVSAVSEKTGLLVKVGKGNSFKINQAIDLNDCSATNPIINFYGISAVRGESDFATITITLTDKYDSTKYVKISANWIANGTGTRTHMAWWKAASQNQNLTGIRNVEPIADHPGKEDEVRTDQWGSYGILSWCMTPYIDGKHLGQEYYGAEEDSTMLIDRATVRIDYETKCVYAGRYTGIFVTDLDEANYYANLWEGFTTGECYVSISMDNYTGENPAQIFITDILGVDLTATSVEDNYPPQITIDTEDYFANDLPHALVGTPYSIFDAVATDFELSPTTISVKVIGNALTDMPYDVPVIDGKFTPASAGWYRIVYKATDTWGNATEDFIDVYAEKSLDALYCELGEYESVGTTGKWVTLPDVIAGNADGHPEFDVQVTRNGEKIAVENGKFLPEIAGQYIVRVKITDYIGRTATEGFAIEVFDSPVPVIGRIPVTPRYLLGGYSNELPLAEAWVYKGTQKNAVQTKIVVTDSTGTKTLDGRAYTPDSGSTEVTVKWIAQNASGTTTSDEVTIPVIGVVDNSGDEPEIAMDKYFVTENMTVTAQSKCVSMNIDGGSAYAEFINVLLAENFEFIFTPVNVGKITLILTGYEKPEERLEIAIDLSSDVAVINGVRRYEISRQSNGGFIIAYTMSQNKVSDGYSKVLACETDGSDFQGFTGGKCYFEFFAEDCKSSASVEVNSISNQTLSSKTFEMIKPAISILGVTGGAYIKGQKVTLFRAAAADVLSPSCTFYCSVTAPDGSFAKDVNGVELNHVSPEVNYDITLDQYGIYVISFYCEDQSENKERNISYSINVIDTTAPVIVLSETVPETVKVGTNYKLPTATATDDLDGELQTFAYVQTPDSKVLKIKTSSYKFEKVGVYAIRFYAADETGNSTILEYSVTVTE